jgi:hypothetical protein
MRISLIAVAGALVLGGSGLAGEQAQIGPPARLVQLEQRIGLRVAHARDEGPVEPDKRKLFLEAEQNDARGEQSLKARDYHQAEDYFTRAGRLLDRLGL